MLLIEVGAFDGEDSLRFHEKGYEELFLVAEVLIERSLADGDLFEDIFNMGVVIPFFGKEPLCAVENLFSSQCPFHTRTSILCSFRFG